MTLEQENQKLSELKRLANNLFEKSSLLTDLDFEISIVSLKISRSIEIGNEKLELRLKEEIRSLKAKKKKILSIRQQYHELRQLIRQIEEYGLPGAICEFESEIDEILNLQEVAVNVV